MDEAGIQPDWVIGTSIGAINAALIAGNPPERQFRRRLAEAPRLEGDDQLKGIDFTPAGIASRQRAGYEAAMQAIAARPWEAPMDPVEGLTVYNADEYITGERRV